MIEEDNCTGTTQTNKHKQNNSYTQPTPLKTAHSLNHRSHTMPEYLKTKAEFDKALADAKAEGKKVFIDFTATWCGPCQMIGPEFVKIAGMDEFKDLAIFYKIDVDENSETSEAVGITCMPTFMVFDGPTKLEEFSGANKAKLNEFVRKHTVGA